MRHHLTRFRPRLDRLAAFLPARHPDDLSWLTLYGLVVLAILAGDLASRLGWSLVVLAAVPIAVVLGLRRDPLAGFAVAAGLLGGIVTASPAPSPPPAIYRGAQLPRSSSAPVQPTGAMPA